MKGGPSIAVMLGHAPEHESEESGEPDLGELKDRAKDAAKALGDASRADKPEAIYRAFEALTDLCHEIRERQGGGEEAEEAEEPEAEKESEHEGGKGDEY